MMKGAPSSSSSSSSLGIISLLFILTTLVQSQLSSSRILHELNVSSSVLGISDQLVSSPNGTFICSFRAYTNRDTHNIYYYLAISFAVSLESHPVWTANRNHPLSATATMSLDSTTGNMVLSDINSGNSNTTFWSTSIPNSTASVAKLQESGNLVLLDDQSRIVWQSFDYPTDTLLPFQKLTFSSGINLTSSLGFTDLSIGRYSLGFYNQTTIKLAVRTDSWLYWQDHVQSEGVFQYDKYGDLTLQLQGTPNIRQFTNLRRLTLDIDGNLRMYTWNPSSQQWNIVWFAHWDICDTSSTAEVNVCGDYGICLRRPQSTCVCPPGLSPVSLDMISKGCSGDPIKNIIPNCNASSTFHYLTIDDINFASLDILHMTGLTEQECLDYCTSHCTCLAAIYYPGEGICWLKGEVTSGYYHPGSRVLLKYDASYNLSSLGNLTTLIEDTYSTDWSNYPIWDAYNVTTSIPLPTSNITYNNDPSLHKHGFSNILIVTCVLGTLVGILIVLSFLTTLMFFRYRKQVTYLKLQGPPIVFNYRELELATKSFSNKLGEGGFGSVYKGELQDGTQIAVKNLEGLSPIHGEKQFKAEIATIGRIHHLNLLRLLGFCCEQEHKLLVYEFMENGSLDNFLFFGQKTMANNEESEKVLDWATRYKISMGVARGLAYLHDECLQCILHCDIKPQNILLDKQFCPKVADFGLACLYSRDHTMRMTTIRGTRGYMAPEWLANLPITTKADVYSFGMLVLEIISGRRNYLYTESAITKEDEQWWCFPMWAFNKSPRDVIDPRIVEECQVNYSTDEGVDTSVMLNEDNGNSISRDNEIVGVNWSQVESIMKVAFLCIQSDIHSRPSMSKVVQMLEGTLPIPKDITPPSLFTPPIDDMP